MQNFRVDNLELSLQKLADEGVTLLGDMPTYEYGKFCWILGIDGNKIEL